MLLASATTNIHDPKPNGRPVDADGDGTSVADDACSNAEGVGRRLPLPCCEVGTN
jgi:hypothetical protein